MRAGLDVQSAIAKADEFIHFKRTAAGTDSQPVPPTPAADIAAQNEAAMQELTRMLGRVA